MAANHNGYMEVLAEAIKTKQHILAIENNIPNTDIGDEFLEMYIENCIKHKIKALQDENSHNAKRSGEACDKALACQQKWNWQ